LNGSREIQCREGSPVVIPAGLNHTDVRPTIMALLDLTDDYVHDGRVVAVWISNHALPNGIRGRREDLLDLAQVFKQLNASKGELGHPRRGRRDDNR
jgi:hypothetical protein